MRRFVLVFVIALAGGALFVPGCTPEIPEGRIGCTTEADCPTGWFCRASRCYSTAEERDAGPVDGGATDGGRLDASADGGTVVTCTTDLDCGNGVFCDGRELCLPDDASADARGCVAAAGDPCLDTQTCDEGLGRCVTDCDVSGDADGDGENSVDCGGDDCDDADRAVRPGLPELCDAIDQDCEPSTLGTTDLDADGAIAATCCNPDGAGGAACGPDCDDNQATVGSGDAETCDALDNDCDGTVDDGVLVTFYLDADTDRFGVTGSTMQACTAPTGYTMVDGDCDDGDAAVNPDATETCNGVDDDCTGGVDDGLSCACTNGTMQACGSDVGECSMGTQTCVGGSWGACTGGIDAMAEACNGRDDDCDTMIDDGADAACPPRASASAACSSGVCRYGCTAPFLTCDTSDAGDATGCEVNPSNDVNHCGSCTPCPTPTNVATRGCASGMCAVTACVPSFGDCDRMFANGCETRLGTTTDCGSCGDVCTAPPNATTSCDTGSCAFRCNAGFSNCDGSGANGCETALGSCDAPPPRLIGPLTAMTVTSNRPELRFATAPGTTMARVQVCSDPACATVVWAGNGTSPITVGTTLAPGRYYWRAFALVGTTVGTTPSAPWSFVTFAMSTPGIATDGFPLMNIAGGVEELAIGDPTTSGGRVLVYEGTNTTAIQTLNAPANRQGFGASVSSIDVNGDGFSDLIVGACMADVSSTTAPSAATGCGGYAVVYPGTNTGRFGTTPMYTMGTGNGTGRVGFGYAVAGIGDFNQDGFGDFAVGAYFSNTVFIYLGAASGSLTEISTTPGAGTSRFGWSVDAAGDLDGDHYDDLVVGTFAAFGGGSRNARVVFGGTTSTPSTADAVGSAPAVSAGLGDVNGDGRSDLAIASAAGTGSLAVWRGGRALFSVSEQIWSVSGVSPANFAAATMGPGDLDRDGLADVIVGVPGTREVYAYQGNTGAMLWRVNDASSTDFGRRLGRGGLLVQLPGVTEGLFLVGACTPGASCGDVSLWSGGSGFSYRGTIAGTAGTSFGWGLYH